MRFCFLLGSVHLVIAHLWRGFRRIRQTSLSALNDAGWIIATAGMYQVVIEMAINGKVLAELPTPVKITVAVGGALMLLFEKPTWNIPKAVLSGGFNIIMSLISLFGDIMSYIRLFAVGLAGGVIAAVFNDLAVSTGPVFMVPVLILGHGLNMCLGLIAVLAHGVRLNMLEFSNHLGMAWVGRKFAPFCERRKVGHHA